MKKANGFIATSVLYSFFLGFITIFIAMITIYLQNRVYLNKLEDSSKNSIYIREIKDKIDKRETVEIEMDEIPSTASNDTLNKLAKCDIIYYYNNGTNPKYIAEGCNDE